MSRSPHLYSIQPLPHGRSLTLIGPGRVRRPIAQQSSRYANALVIPVRRGKAVTDGRRGVTVHGKTVAHQRMDVLHRASPGFRFLPALKCGASAKGVE
jgi:hypothetical protein